MKKILIISPHFPPSNLASVHRSRLFAQHLPSYGWEPVILTVDEKYYEEKPDYNLMKLLSPGLRIEKARAFRVTRPRFIGDIGLRGFFQLYKKGKALIKKEKIDFLYITIPSFYVALLGRWLHASTGIRYGIDFIDPWVHFFPGSNRVFSRHWLSMKLAGLLEPVAVKNAALITGVAEGYYAGVFTRNPRLANNTISGAMPYGGEISDYVRINALNIAPYIFEKRSQKLQLVYAGAMLPQAYAPLEKIFESITAHPLIFSDAEFYFIGTGKTPDDPGGFNIRPLAEKHGLWEKTVFEHPQRIPYADVLVHLNAADGIFILGSTEAHYTPSKIFQGILSKKPVLAVLHAASPAVKMLESSNAGIALTFDGEKDLEKLKTGFAGAFNRFKVFLRSFTADQIDMSSVDQYSAFAVTGKLASLLNQIIPGN